MTEKQTGRINAQLLTKCINHWADSANFKGVTFNKLCSGLAVKCFEMPNASYTNRYVGNKCKKTDNQSDTIVINNNKRKDLAF